MLFRLAAEDDFDDWRCVAQNVKHIFRAPTMDQDPEFLDYARRKLARQEAYTAVDEHALKCIGFIGFSRHFNRITWFGVLDQYRNQGIGTQLLEQVIKELDASKPITVETYRKDYLPGQPARHLYFKLGFKEIDDTLYDNQGNEICRLAILPTM